MRHIPLGTNPLTAVRVGWRHKAYVGAHWVIAYPPQYCRINSPTLGRKKVAVFGGLAISMLRQVEIL